MPDFELKKSIDLIKKRIDKNSVLKNSFNFIKDKIDLIELM